MDQSSLQMHQLQIKRGLFCCLGLHITVVGFWIFNAGGGGGVRLMIIVIMRFCGALIDF